MPPAASTFIPTGGAPKPSASVNAGVPNASSFIPSGYTSSSSVPQTSNAGVPDASSFIPKGGAPDSNAAPGYFQTKSPTGTFLGISDQNDISGKPYFAYKPPNAATTTDYTRVATTFDPRVAQPLTPAHVQNGRMPESVSEPIKKALGGQYSDELDHSIALELSGSNNPANLRIEPGRTGGESAQFDTEENALAKLVHEGKMSLWDAQYKLASDKHASGDNNAIPFVDKEQAAKGMDFPTTPEGDKTIARAAYSGLDNSASTIKYPFIDKMMAAGPSNNPIVGATKWLVELPEEAARTGQEILSYVFNHGKVPEDQKGVYTVNALQEYGTQMYNSLKQQGASDAYATFVATMYGVSAGILDLLPVGGGVAEGVEDTAAHGFVSNEDLVKAHIDLGSPSTMEEAKANRNAALHINHPDVIQGAGGTAEDVARATETTAKINDAYSLLQKEGLPRQGLIQKAAGYASSLIKPLNFNDLINALSKKIGSNEPAAVADSTLALSEGGKTKADLFKAQDIVKAQIDAGDKSPATIAKFNAIADKISALPSPDISGAAAARSLAPETTEKVHAAVKSPVSPTEQIPALSIGQRTTSEIQQDLEQAQEHKAWLEDHLSGHPGRGVGKFINHRTGELLKGGDVAAMQQMGQEESGGGDLDTILKHGENFKAAESQLKAVKNEIARYQSEMKTAKSSNEPLAEEAKKYKSVEEFVKAQTSSYSISDKGYDTVYHETSPAEAKSLVFAYGDKRGLNVSPSSDLALGQKGTGAKIEFDTKRLEGNASVPDLSGKPSKFEITNAPDRLTKDVKSVVFDKEPVGGFGNWNKEILPDGKIKYSNPDQPLTKSQLTDFYNKVKETEPANLPEFPVPEDKSVVLSASFPGAGTISKFLEKDVIPAGVKAGDFVKQVYLDSKNLFSPPDLVTKVKAIAGSEIIKAEQMKSIAWRAASKRRAWIATAPRDTQIDILNLVESGAINPSDFPKYSPAQRKVLSDIATLARERMNIVYARDTANGIEMNYVENYLQHKWKNTKKAKAFFTQLRKKMGSTAFAKMREIDFYNEGIKAGLEPLTTNIEEIVTMREIDSIILNRNVNIFKELDKLGAVLPHETAPSDWKSVTHPDGRILFVPPDIYSILDNGFFAQDLWHKEGVIGNVFRNMMAIKGNTVPIMLTASLYHPILVHIVRASDQVASAIGGAIRGTMTPREAIWRSVKGLTLVNQVQDVRKNYGLIKKWDANPKTWTPEERTIFGYWNDAGFLPKMSEEFQAQATDALKKAIRDQNYIGWGIRLVPKIIEIIYTPLFKVDIPSLMAASMNDGIDQLMRAHPEFATDDVARRVAFRALAEHQHAKFAMLNYKTKFWDPYLKGAMQASFLSPSMTLAPLTEGIGGIKDMGSLIMKGAKGKASKDDVTHRMLSALVLPLVIALYGGITTYMMTGNRPKEWKDYFFPQTGKKNSDGTPQRISMPTYLNSYFSLNNNIDMYGLPKGVGEEAWGKTNPFPRWLSELYSNSDYYGNEMRNPNDPIAKQSEQMMASFFNNNIMPITATNAMKGGTLSALGLNPAPSYINRTAMQNKIIALVNARTGGTKPMESVAATNAKKNIRDLYQSGKLEEANAALQDAIASGYISQRGVAAFIKDADLPSDVRAFQSLAQFPSDQEHLLSQMSAQDLSRYVKYASSKIKEHLSSLSPTAYQFVQDYQSGKVKLDEFRRGQVINNP